MSKTRKPLLLKFLLIRKPSTFPVASCSYTCYALLTAAAKSCLRETLKFMQRNRYDYFP